MSATKKLTTGARAALMRRLDVLAALSCRTRRAAEAREQFLRALEPRLPPPSAEHVCAWGLAFDAAAVRPMRMV